MVILVLSSEEKEPLHVLYGWQTFFWKDVGVCLLRVGEKKYKSEVRKTFQVLLTRDSTRPFVSQTRCLRRQIRPCRHGVRAVISLIHTVLGELSFCHPRIH